MPRRTIFLVVGLAIILTSCFKELADDLSKVDNLTWNPTLALPLANGSFTIEEFAAELSGDNFTTSSRDDGLVVFHYWQDQVFTQTAEEMIDIQDENYIASIKPLEADLPDLPLNGTITVDELHEFTVTSTTSDKLYSAIFKGGNLEIGLSGNFPASGNLVFTFHDLTRDGVPVETSFQWDYDPSNLQQFQRTIDLAGLDVDYSNGGTTYNYFHFTSTLTLNFEGQTVTNTESIDLNMDVISMEFYEANANTIRRNVYSETNQFKFNFLDELAGGIYYFDEPSINFRFYNSFGIPAEATLIETIARSITKGDLTLTGDIVGNPITVNHPTEKGQVVLTELNINYQNSNLPEIIAWQPDEVSYTFDGVVNPASNDDIHFVLDTSRIGADVDLELPMIGIFRNLSIAENYDFNGEDLEEVEYALFRLQTNNGFPINAHLQIYFGSGTGTLIDSLIYDDKKILEAGIVDAIGKVTEPSLKTTDVLVPKERLGAISQAQRLILRVKLYTPQNDTQSVRIYDQDRLSLKLYVQTEFEINL